ncbi:hypothetical protein [Alkalibacterium thalassium]|uniref:hypothetical protein n=1 Tax=Alkalibacterium thalassium TaxID=426701 RepID=UPI000B862E28|nr:hypothetical protein [Alkalibacterium thalassium]
MFKYFPDPVQTIFEYGFGYCKIQPHEAFAVLAVTDTEQRRSDFLNLDRRLVQDYQSIYRAPTLAKHFDSCITLLSNPTRRSQFYDG